MKKYPEFQREVQRPPPPIWYRQELLNLPPDAREKLVWKHIKADTVGRTTNISFPDFMRKWRMRWVVGQFE